VCFSKEQPSSSSSTTKSSRFTPQVTGLDYAFNNKFALRPDELKSPTSSQENSHTITHEITRKNTHWHVGQTQSHSAEDGHGLRWQRESSGRRRTDDRGRILQLSSTGGGANYRYTAWLACLKGRRQAMGNR